MTPCGTTTCRTAVSPSTGRSFAQGQIADWLEMYEGDGALNYWQHRVQERVPTTS